MKSPHLKITSGYGLVLFHAALIAALTAFAPAAFCDGVDQLLVLAPGERDHATVRAPLSLREVVFHVLAPSSARRDKPSIRVLQTGGPLAVEAPDVKASAETLDAGAKAGLFRITVQFPAGEKEVSYRVLMEFTSETGVPIQRDVTLHRYFLPPGNPPPGEASSIKTEPIR